MINILIVCANKLYADTISMALSSPQLQIHSTDHRTCPLSLCRQTPFSLVIFLNLSPYFTSMNMAEQLRQGLTYTPAIYVLAASHSENAILSLLECGVNQYITFPVNLYRLRQKVYRELKLDLC